MQKKLIGMTVGAMAMAVMSVNALAVTCEPLSVPEMAAMDATHVVTLTHADLTTTNLNTAQTVAVMNVATCSVELVQMVLITAFDATTGVTDRCGIEVGDGTDVDLFMVSTEVDSDGTEVWQKFGRFSANTITTVVESVTNTYTVLLGSSATERFGRKVYTSADTVDVVATPNSAIAVNDYTAGEIRLYFRVTRKGER
jgi:hypothetical protein